jgi:hypothetical protein
VLGQLEHAPAGTGMQRGGQRQGICVETTPKEFVHTSLARVHWTRGWRGTGPRGAHGRASAWRLRGYTRSGRATPGSRRRAFGRINLARGQVARGFIVELLAWHLGWSSDGQRRSGDGMPWRTAVDTTVQGGR